ncbi:MAG: ABC-F family ATP-binding cassette domain-containing protein, partial [Firmicutes bacterium]|nr:ABC-F family ATP-binding cassette domain-containing protein [Bacillota bacterium]
RPSLLIMDEPTNYLDVEGIQWLEGFLGSYPRAFIVVSHDRYFLDKIANRIWELDNHRLYQYRGNYSQYLPERNLRREQLEAALEKQEVEKRRAEAFISKFGAGTRARQAKSVEKRMKRLPQLRVLEDDPQMAFSFEPKHRSGNNIVFLENIGKAFDGKFVFQGIQAEIKRGQRIALLGANGSGKSTLLKILAGELAFQGRLHWGAGIDSAYFSQEIRFKGNNTVLEELYAEHRLDFGLLRSVLGRFLFSGEDVFKKTEVLSGGERNRLALAKLLLHRANFLLLDEPTNHLDVFAREALENALKNFSGTILFVSHDRYFIDKIANRIWLLDSGCLTEFEGNFSYYERVQAAQKTKTGRSPGIRKKQGAREKKAGGPSLRQLKRQRELVEDQIVDLEKRQSELETKLSSPQLYQDETESIAVVQEYQKIQGELGRKYELWENLVDKLEKGRI